MLLSIYRYNYGFPSTLLLFWVSLCKFLFFRLLYSLNTRVCILSLTLSIFSPSRQLFFFIPNSFTANATQSSHLQHFNAFRKNLTSLSSGSQLIERCNFCLTNWWRCGVFLSWPLSQSLNTLVHRYAELRMERRKLKGTATSRWKYILCLLSMNWFQSGHVGFMSR